MYLARTDIEDLKKLMFYYIDNNMCYLNRKIQNYKKYKFSIFHSIPDTINSNEYKLKNIRVEIDNFINKLMEKDQLIISN